MVFAKFEGSDVSPVNVASSDRTVAASSRMFDEVRNYQAVDQVNSFTKCIGQSADIENGKCLSLTEKEISKMLTDFGIDEPLPAKPRPVDPGHNPGSASGKPDRCSDKPGVQDVKPDKYTDKYPSKPGSKPWQPEFGVCAPGSPYKIDCFDDKDRSRKVK